MNLRSLLFDKLHRNASGVGVYDFYFVEYTARMMLAALLDLIDKKCDKYKLQQNIIDMPTGTEFSVNEVTKGILIASQDFRKFLIPDFVLLAPFIFESNVTDNAEETIPEGTCTKLFLDLYEQSSKLKPGKFYNLIIQALTSYDFTGLLAQTLDALGNHDEMAFTLAQTSVMEKLKTIKVLPPLFDQEKPNPRPYN